MQPTPSKKAKFNIVLRPLEIHNWVKTSLQNLLSGSSVLTSFPSSLSLAQPFNNSFSSPSRFPFPRNSSDCHQALQKPRQSLPIGSEGPLNLLLVACQRAKKELEAKNGEAILSEENSDTNSTKEENHASPHPVLISEDSFSKEDSSTSEEEDDWKDDAERSQAFSWIDTDNTSHAKEKLIKILAEEVLIPKQRWILCKMLATLVYHRKDPRLRSAFRQFQSFAYQTIMTESEHGGRWPGFLTQKDCNLMIRLCFRQEIEK